MTQGTQEYSSANKRFLRHGIIGRFAPSGNVTQSSSHLADMCDALQTQFPLTTTTATHFEAASTDSLHELATGGVVIVAGRPHFRNPELTALAATDGCAAAIALGYTQFAQDVFGHLYGAFCCAIVDAAADRVLVGIDRLGQYSLYYGADDNGLAFGSYAGSTLAAAGKPPQLLNQGIYNYVYFHMVPAPDSAYQGLKKLSAAHYLDYRNGDCQVSNYWQPKFSEATDTHTFEALCGQLKEVLRGAVKNSYRSNEKVGAFLSGGLDSSTVTGMLAEISEEQASAYSIGFSAEGYDEMAFARITAGHFGVALNEYYVTPQDVVAALPLVATSYEEPFGNSSALPAYFCAKMAAENGVGTLLAGDGGDEFFAGNERYLQRNIFEAYATIPAALRKGLIEPLARMLPATLPLVPKVNSFISQANTPMPDRLQSYNFLHQHLATEIFSDDFMAQVSTEVPLALTRSIYHRPQPASDLNRMLYLDWQITLADNDLRKVTHTCALAGVDVVYPMLDDALVEFSCQVPSNWKIKGKDLRHFYKQALQGWLPDETITKTKQGFGLPFGVWMQTYKPLREMAYDNMLKLKSRNFIRPEFIDKAIEMHQSEHAAYYGELVWIFTVFELWMDAHAQPGGY